MTRRQLLCSLDSRELSDWQAFFKAEAESVEEMKQPKKDSPEVLASKIKGAFAGHQKKVKKKK
jgi:hypothetical protein